MNKQLSALTDDEWAAMDFDDLAPDVPTAEPTAEQYQQALARLATMRQATIDGGTDYDDLHLDICNDTVTMAQDGQWIWLSPEMLQAAADWVARCNV